MDQLDQKKIENNLASQNIIQEQLTDVAKRTYLDYAMSVIIGRAIPDVRDGLKPVHRRILFAMHDLKITPKGAYKKSARVVGDVIGKYHPHGDTSVYDAMIGLSQDFNISMPLVDGQGNWGNIDGDKAAAMRYCLTGDSLIKTNNGLIAIKDMVKDSSIPEQDIDINIYSLGNKVNKASKFFNSGKHSIVKIISKNGYELKGSVNHPILTLQKDKIGKPYYSWKKLEDITTDDYILIDRNETNSKNYKNYKNKAIIFGALLTEGSISAKRITFSNTDKVLMDKFIKAYEKEYDNEYYLYNRELPSGKTFYEFDVQKKSSKFFKCKFFKELKGLKSKDKKIPSFLFKSSKSVQKIFLQTIFECDGSISYIKSDNLININYDSISKQLINEIKILLLNFGIFSKLNYQQRDDSWKIYLGNKINVNKFIDRIGFLTNKKIKQLEYQTLIKNDKKTSLYEDKIPFLSSYLKNKYKNNYLNKNNIDNYSILNNEDKKKKIFKFIDKGDRLLIDDFIQGNYFYDKVKIIKSLPKEEVYSIKVDSECHSFIANGIINHNTESRMTSYGYAMLNNMEKESVDFRPNFDDSLQEPTILPSMLPNILVNGTEGIAVGMATNMAPHNVNEVINATLSMLKNPDITIKQLRRSIKGPDMPTAGIIMKDSMDGIYETGQGRFHVKARYNVEEDGKKIVVTEIPYQTKKPRIIEQIAELVRDKQIFGITGAQDESNKHGLRLVISIKKGENVKIIMNTLYKRTDLQNSYSIKNLVIDDGEPKVLNLKEIIGKWITFRKVTITRNIQYDVDRLNRKMHLLRGIVIALNNLDKTLKIIRNSKNSTESKASLIEEFDIDEIQSQAIIDTKLQKLSSMETESIFEELGLGETEINRLETIIATDENLTNFINIELKDLNRKIKVARRSEITNENYDISNEELITDEDVAIIITKDGFIRKTGLDNFRVQHRGGKGKTIITLREGDFVKKVLFCKNNEHLTVFTKNNKAFGLPVYTITESSKGRLVNNLIEDNTGAFDIIHSTNSNEMIFITKTGQVVKLSGKHFTNIRKNGIKAIRLNDNDRLVKVIPITKGDTHLMITTNEGYTMTTELGKFKTSGRGTIGVRGMSLKPNNYVVDSCVVNQDDKVLLISEKGYGKQNNVSEFRVTNRGSKGVKSFKISDKTGSVVGIIKSDETKDLVVTTKKGIIIRTPLEKISTNNNRVTVGVKVINIQEADFVISFDSYEKMEDYDE